MGAWGTGPFANDDAADWAYELEDAADLGPVRQALAATLDTDGWLEVPEAAIATAAAAVVAGSFDGAVAGLPEEVADWLDDHPDAAGPQDARLAVDALQRVISEDSELLRLWADSPEGPAWAREVDALHARLVRAIGD